MWLVIAQWRLSWHVITYLQMYWWDRHGWLCLFSDPFFCCQESDVEERKTSLLFLFLILTPFFNISPEALIARHGSPEPRSVAPAVISQHRYLLHLSIRSSFLITLFSQLLSVKSICQDHFLICSAAGWSCGQTLSMISNFHWKHWLVCIQAFLVTFSTLTWWSKTTNSRAWDSPRWRLFLAKGQACPAPSKLLRNSHWDGVSDQVMKVSLGGMAIWPGRTQGQKTSLWQGAGYLQYCSSFSSWSVCTPGVRQIT